MTEVFVLVECKKSVVKKIVALITFVIGVLSFICSFVLPILFIPATIILVVGYFLQFRSNKEYECSYFDGEFRFARIMNKSRRKQLKVFSIEEVMQIAPAGDRSMYQYENDKQVHKVDLTSGKKDVPYYEMVVKAGNKTNLISFEPDDKYLDAVCVKYPQKVIRRKEA